DHVTSFARRLGAGIHGDSNVSLCQGRSVIGAVADHRDQFALGLLIANQPKLGLGSGFGLELIYTGLVSNRGRRERIVASDHDGLQAHCPKPREALADTFLDNVFEMDDTENAGVLSDDQWSAAAPCDSLHDSSQLRRRRAAIVLDEFDDLLRRTLADSPAVQINAAHPRRRRE